MARKRYPEVKTIEQARAYVDEYLLYLIEIGKSPSSIATTKAALVKVFQTDASAFVETPERTRAGITRSRLDVNKIVTFLTRQKKGYHGSRQQQD